MNGPITEIQSMLSNGLSRILIAGGPCSCIDSSQSDRINKDYRAFAGRGALWRLGMVRTKICQLAKVLFIAVPVAMALRALEKYTEGMELETADEPARRHDWRDD
jgi:hypothetical protein